jgi:penicillin-binding protein 1A
MARSRTARLLLAIALLGAAGLAAAAAAAAVLYASLVRDLPALDTLADYRPPLTSTVLDRHGTPIGEFFEFRRRLTALAEVPEVVIQAFLAAEDRSFYEHTGVDYLSILRAAWVNLRGGETLQGGSTITQQTVKQLLLTPERTYRRKMRELLLARRIEQSFSKEEILFLYLNEIYFGSGAYGIGEAALTYFGKPITELDVGEAALLAGLPKAPTVSSPFVSPARAEERRRYVLGRMRDEGFIDDATHEHARSNPPRLGVAPERQAFATASYFTEDVRRELVARLGNAEVLRGGLTIETTLDLDLQRVAVDALRDGLEALDRRRGYRGPVHRVEGAEVEAELARVAGENRLGEDALPSDRRLLGMVVALEEGAARVAFAPGREARVALEDVRWARPVERRGAVRAITDVFAVGDVAPFRVLAPEEDAAREDLPRAALAQEPEVQGALVALDLERGDVMALVGGYDFEDSEFDRATQAVRQAGSAFKPFVYAAALERGWTPVTILYDRPMVVDDGSGTLWRPQNYGRRFYGPLTMYEALARSVNNATAHLLRDVGIDAVIDLAQRLGITTPLERNLALALGVGGVTLLELTRSYAAFGAGGRVIPARFIERVLDRDGRVLLEDVPLAQPPLRALPAEPAEGQPLALAGDEAPRSAGPGAEPRALEATHAYLATALLRGVIEHPEGTGRRSRALGRPLAGKTGTTNDQGDAWFVGFSPDVAAGVWVGFDEKRVLGSGETGGRAALPIWTAFMEAALAERPRRDFDVPEGVVFARVDPRTGAPVPAAAANSIFQPFIEGTEPRERAEAAPAGTEAGALRLDF